MITSNELQFKRTYFLIGLNLVLILSLIALNWKSTLHAKSMVVPPDSGPNGWIDPYPTPKTDKDLIQDNTKKTKVDIFKDPIVSEEENKPTIPQQMKKLLGIGEGQITSKLTPETITIDPSFGTEDNDTIYNFDPTFTLGAFDQYLKKRIKMPSLAIQYGISGTVVIEFVVEKDGSVQIVKAIAPAERRLGYGIEENCIQAIRGTSGFWEPATLNGIKVRSRFRVPIEIDNSSMW